VGRIKNNFTGFFPILDWGKSINKKSLWQDFIAGLTTAVIVLPQGVAIAIIAGLPPIYGLYAAMVMPVITAIFGSSLKMINGPTVVIAIVIYSSVSQYETPNTQAYIELALILTFLVGLFQLLMGILKIGSLTNFVSHTVVIGFTAGAGILIAIKQLKFMLGIGIPGGSSFYEVLYYSFQHINETNLYVLIIAVSTLVIALLSKKLIPKLPYMLIAMIGGSLVAWFLRDISHNVSYIGEMPANLPPFHIPDIQLSTLIKIAPDAFAIALFGLIEAIAIARAIGIKTHQEIDPNQESVGQGAANLIGSFFSSIIGSGSFSRTALNVASGAKTPLSGVFSAVLLAILVLFVAPLTKYIPIAAMGAIIAFAGYNLIDKTHIRAILKSNKIETIILFITLLATLFLKLEFAIYIGVIFSLLFYLQKTSKPRIVSMAPNPKTPERHIMNIHRAELDECPQLKIIRIDGSMFFGAVFSVSKRLSDIRHAHKQKRLLILGSGINFIDIAGAEMFTNEIRKWDSIGGRLYISGLKKPVQDVLEKGGYYDKIGREHFFESKKEAITSIYNELDKDICSRCEVKIFKECDKEL
jgi:sulfate permease, SulP family